MKAQQINVARVIRGVMFGSILLIAGIIGANKAHAQAGDIFARVVGQVVGNVVIATVDGVSCAATASINQAGRGGRNAYNQYQRSSDYTQCASQANMNRQMAQQQRYAMEQQAYYRQQAEAPRCQYYERNGRQYRACDETVRGPWR